MTSYSKEPESVTTNLHSFVQIIQSKAKASRKLTQTAKRYCREDDVGFSWIPVFQAFGVFRIEILH